MSKFNKQPLIYTLILSLALSQLPVLAIASEATTHASGDLKDAQCDQRLQAKLNEFKAKEAQLIKKVESTKAKLISTQKSITSLQKNMAETQQKESVEEIANQKAQNTNDQTKAQLESQVLSLEAAVKTRENKVAQLQEQLSSVENEDQKNQILSQIAVLDSEKAQFSIQLEKLKSDLQNYTSASDSNSQQSVSQSESASLKGDIGVKDFERNRLSTELDKLNSELTEVKKKVNEYEKYFNPELSAEDFANFEGASEEEPMNKADQALLDLTGLAAAGVALSCTPHIDAETEIPDSYTLFKAASADFLAKSRENTKNHQIKARQIVCFELNPEVENDEQYKQMKKALLQHMQTTDSVENKLKIARETTNMYDPAYAAALKEVKDKKKHIKKREREVEEAKDNVKDKKDKDNLANMALMAATAVAMLWKGKADTETEPVQKVAKQKRWLVKAAIAAAAGLYKLKTMNDVKKAEEKQEEAEKAVEIAQFYNHLDCGGGGGQSTTFLEHLDKIKNQSYAALTRSPWSPSLKTQIFSPLTQANKSSSFKIQELFSFMPKARASRGEAVSLGLGSQSGAAQYFIQTKNQHLQEQRQAFEVPASRANYLGGVLAVGEEATAIMEDSLSQSKKAESELTGIMSQMGQQLRTEMMANAAKSVPAGKTHPCYSASSGVLKSDESCSCRETNSCSDFQTTLNSTSTPLSNASTLALQAANERLNGNAGKANAITAALGKNAASFKSYRAKLQRSLEKESPELAANGSLDEQAQTSFLRMRERSMNAFRNAAPRLAGISGFSSGAAKKAETKKVAKANYDDFVDSDYKNTQSGAARYISSNSKPGSFFKKRNTRSPKSLSFKNKAPAKKYDNPHEGISAESGPSLWEIITSRYGKSAYDRLFE